jgi:hypothetical protein
LGLTYWQSVSLNVGRIQLSPAGILVADNGGVGNFVTDPGQVYYLRRKPTHQFTWVSSQHGDAVNFAVDFGTESSGTAQYFARMVTNSTVFVGIVPLYMGVMYYLDGNRELAEATTGYEVLVCKTNVCKLRPVRLVVSHISMIL